ncbi:hypothetical protein CLV62_101217 [Dysgonomonas alginatilytica]|uniref:Uncharacterized protein n=1 Tax=Dysgonomonas alginatilytica TaxID=1605892 RepID=A0A2V3PVU8_9BACT|nr:hypothetical protein [Dysgonomonas alginatilytica]PXV68951.1 hypothetical protein CLV62_101217 [Dysgonomonas alginatilytica]
MKINLSCILVLLIIYLCPLAAQIGVNLENPEALFHLDSKKNNATATATTKYLDDVIIDNNGNLVIGAKAAVAGAKVTVTGESGSKGVLKIVDGTQGEGYILHGNNEGVGDWVNFKTFPFNKYCIWTLQNTAFSFSSIGKKSNLTGTASIDYNEITGASTASSAITMPKGRYLILAAGEIESTKENAILHLLVNGTETNKVYYSDYVNGSIFYQDLSQQSAISLQWEAVDTNNIYYAAPPFQKPYKYSLTFIRIKD